MMPNKSGLGFRLGEQGEELTEGGFPASANALAAVCFDDAFMAQMEAGGGALGGEREGDC